MSAKSLTKARGSSAMAWLFLAPTLVGIAICRRGAAAASTGPWPAASPASPWPPS